MSFLFDNDNNIIQAAVGTTITLDPQSGYLIAKGTGGVQLPYGTTLQQPSVTTPVVRYNTSLGLFEGYNVNASAWQQFQQNFTTLNSLGALSTNGLVVNNGGTISSVSITAGTGITVANGSGVGGSPTISLTSPVTVALGGTGLTTAPTNGQLLIGNGSTYSLGTLTAGTGIGVSNTSGAITLSNTGVTSITGTSNQVIASASTGAITLSLPQSIATTSTPTFAQLTISNSPVNATDAATKSYVDTSVQGLSFKETVAAATTANLSAAYSNGSSGVGATLTNSGTQAAFAVDGYTASLNDRILVKNQTTAYQNGIYVVTTLGSASTNWVLTRSSDANTGANLVGAYVFVDNGTQFADTSFAQTTPATITIGTTSLTWTQFSGAGTYTAGTGLTLTGTQFSITSPIATTIGGTGLTTIGTANQFLSVNTAGTGLEYKTISGTTNQISVAAASGTLTLSLPSSVSTGNLTLSGITANSFLYSGASGALTTTSAPTNGQLLIGSTGNAPVAGAITGSTGLSVTLGAGTIALANTGVTSNVAGTGISVSGATGAVTITNTGVTSAVAGTGISVSASTGAVTFANTGVTAIAGTSNQITASASTGSITLSLPSAVSTGSLTLTGLTANAFLYSGTGGALTTTSAPTNGQILVGKTGSAPVATTITAGTNISVTNGSGAITIATTGVQTSLLLYKENPSSQTSPTATGTNAVAIGNAASAAQTNAVAVGANAVTEWVSETAVGSSYYSTAGDSKTSFSVATCTTTNATATEIGFNTSSGSPTSYVAPALNSTYYFEVIVVAHRTDVTGTRYCEKLEFLFDQGATASTATIVGNPLTTIITRDSGANAWSVAISANTTAGRPVITVTGAASSTIRWVAQIRAVKVT